MFDRLLVPLDGSDSAERALPFAMEVAEASSGEVLLVCISESNSEQERSCQTYLDSLVTRVQSWRKPWRPKSRNIRCEVATGNPAKEIIKSAAHHDIKLIVLASKGRSGEGPWPLGGVASKVVQKSVVPIMLVKTSASPAPVGLRGLIKKILLPLDASEPGAAAVPYAAELARIFEASIVLFHVEPQPRPWLIAPGVEFAYLPATSSEQQGKKLLDHMDYLERTAQSLRDRGLTVSVDAGSGAPAAEISGYAMENHVDLIALSSHGQSGIAEFVYGGVTEKLLNSGGIPVLVVRPHK